MGRAFIAFVVVFVVLLLIATALGLSFGAGEVALVFGLALAAGAFVALRRRRSARLRG